MTKVESVIDRGPEASPPKERFAVDFSSFEIVGKAGTGKTSAARMLAELYGIPKDRIIFTGQLFRQITGGSSGFMQRPLSVDERIDNMQRDYILTASPANPVIIEGRLAGVIAREEHDRHPELRAPSFLFVAPTEIRMRRLLERTLEERDKEIERLQEEQEEVESALTSNASPEIVVQLYERITALKMQDINLKTVKQNEGDREIGDLGQWRQLHPQLEGVDLFNPANRDANGRKIYDFVISTGRLSKLEVALEVHRILFENGYVYRKAA